MECLDLATLSDDSNTQLTLTRNILARYTSKDCEKRVSSSSASEKVVVIDCRWVLPHGTTSSHLVCALNDGEICLLDTNSLLKIHLLGSEEHASSSKAIADGKKDEKRSSHRREKVGLDCHSFSSNNALLLVAAGKKVEALLIDPLGTDPKRATKGAPTKIADYPTVGEGSFGVPTVRFSNDGLSFFVHISFTPGDQLPKQYILAGTQQNGGKYHVMLPWKDLNAFNDTAIGAELMAHDLLCINWWSADEVVCVWSNGLVQLFNLTRDKLTAQGFIMGDADDDMVHYTLAGVCPPNGAADSCGLLGVVLSHNIACTFTVKVVDSTKRAKLEHASDRHMKRIEFVPTERTYCSDEVPMREISLFWVHSPVLSVVLESGAIIFLDAVQLVSLAHKPFKRLYEPSLNLYEEEQETRPSKQFFSAVVGKPFSMCLVERNTVIVMKAV